ncbi:MAG: PAS domain-containing protein [Bacteroidia bacterium]|nr:PAS domain-containing protein [Bacteroidia bacterium]
MKDSRINLREEMKSPNNQLIIRDFPIVGIGASAGGLEALEQFFSNMPKDSGMAFVVIQHLDPTHLSIMPELLQRITPMKVFQATDQLKVNPDCIYVISPNTSLSLLNGALNMFDVLKSHSLRLPIDIFFRSLALDRQEKSIGIILSGMGSDGSLGLKAMKEKNGIVLVQDPASAKFDGMPRSAIDTVIADIVAPAQELPAKLIALLKFIPVVKTEPEKDDKFKSNLDKIIILLREQTGHDFSLYKTSTLVRRIEKRKGIHLIDKTHDYVRFCQQYPKEVDILFKELLIRVTSFFRDPAVWDMLKENVLPGLINELPNGYVVRAWVPACSTGEEAYSLAIIFIEALEKAEKHKSLTLQIFATDPDQDAIEVARKGIFSSNIIADVSPERLSRFFKAEGESYRVNAPIREMVVFAPQNVIKDPPFTRLDIVTCRNMLIYMELELQKKVIALFNYNLNPGGIMVLGTAETLGKNSEGFEEIDAKCKIFQRSASVLASELIDFPSSFSPAKRVAAEIKTPTDVAKNIQTLTDQILLQRFAPSSVLVNDKDDIIYVTGRIGKYLEQVAGKASLNIYAMAREGLRQVLPGAFRRAMQNFDAVIVRNVKVGTNGGTQFVDVTVQRMENPDPVRGMILVIFNDVPDVVEHDVLNPKTGKRSSPGRQMELEIELQRSYEEIQIFKEEMQTWQEELKSTNEELQSTNEELQSTNEELLTSKEEMQSLNEELLTVNVELRSKIEDYKLANDYVKNLLDSTEIPTIFLDKELNILRFTDNAINIFKLRHTDIGRPFTDLVTDLLYPEVGNHAQQVIKTLTTLENSIPTNDGRWFQVRIMPFLSTDDLLNGLVITFQDISLAKKLEIELKETIATLETREIALNVSEIRYRRLFESSKDGMLILDAETGKVTDVNPFLIKLLGYSHEQFMGKAIWDIGSFKDIVSNKEKFSELQHNEYIRYEDLPLEAADGQRIDVEFISNVYVVDNHKVIQCQIRNITERRQAEEALRSTRESQ